MIEKKFEPSRIRRGRMTVNPVWIVKRDDGWTGRFHTKKAAVAFDAAGCTHDKSRLQLGWCGGCRGTIRKETS